MRLGNIYQYVVYESLNLLCFSCGRLGHWKDNCPYTIQEPILTPVDDVVVLEPEEVKEVVVNTSDEYGPWTMVQHKNSGCKTDSKKPISPRKSHNFIPSVAGSDRAHGSSSPFRSLVVDTHDHSESKRKLQNQSLSPVCSSELHATILPFPFNSVVSPHCSRTLLSPEASSSLVFLILVVTTVQSFQ